MKHKIRRITRDMEGIKEGKVLPKAKEHLTLPLKTSLRIFSKINKLHKLLFFFPSFRRKKTLLTLVSVPLSVPLFVADSNYPHVQMRNRSYMSYLRSHKARAEHSSFGFQDCDLKHNLPFFSTSIAASISLKTQHSGYHNFTLILTHFLHQCSAFNYFKMYL